MQNSQAASVMFISHGGGPLPLLGDSGHSEMIKVIEDMRKVRGQPRAVVVVSAHWESEDIAVTASSEPSLLYDYYGFEPRAYEIDYPCAGSPEVAEEVTWLLSQHGIVARKDTSRGLDHGVFVPMKLLFPEANVPCVQVSLKASLDPKDHIRLGHALQALKQSNVLILGSGFTFHNMSAFFRNSEKRNEQAQIFLDWLLTTSEDNSISQAQREEQLVEWEGITAARFNHPREEHLLPFIVCAAAAGVPIDYNWRHQILDVPCASVAWR